MTHPVEHAVIEQHQERRTVAVFCLGGTIAMTADPDTGRAIPALTASRLVDAVPGLDALRLTLRTRENFPTDDPPPSYAPAIPELLGLLQGQPLDPDTAGWVRPGDEP